MLKQRKPLTPKEIKLVKGIAEGKTKQAAALVAYKSSTPEIASVTASKALKKTNVQEALAEAFAAHGITIDHAIAPIGKALKATKVVIHGNGDEAFAEVVEDVELQLKGSDRALKLMGIGQQTGDVTINFINQSEDQRGVYDL